MITIGTEQEIKTMDLIVYDNDVNNHVGDILYDGVAIVQITGDMCIKDKNWITYTPELKTIYAPITDKEAWEKRLKAIELFIQKAKELRKGMLKKGDYPLESHYTLRVSISFGVVVKRETEEFANQITIGYPFADMKSRLLSQCDNELNYFAKYWFCEEYCNLGNAEPSKTVNNGDDISNFAFIYALIVSILEFCTYLNCTTKENTKKDPKKDPKKKIETKAMKELFNPDDKNKWWVLPRFTIDYLLQSKYIGDSLNEMIELLRNLKPEFKVFQPKEGTFLYNYYTDRNKLKEFYDKAVKPEMEKYYDILLDKKSNKSELESYNNLIKHGNLNVMDNDSFLFEYRKYLNKLNKRTMIIDGGIFDIDINQYLYGEEKGIRGFR